jgi:chromosome segregation ATPase
MAEPFPSTRTATADADLPDVCLEVGNGTARPSRYVVAEAGFVIGTVPGCDLRLPGTEGPGVLCLVARRPGGAIVRKLSPTLPLLVNGKAVATADLASGDRVKAGPVEMVVFLEPATPAARPRTETPSPALDPARQQLQQQVKQFREQVVRFEQDKHKHEQDLAARRAALEEASAAASNSQERDRERERDLAKQAEELAVQRQELAAQRQELADIRTQLYDRYRERRDRLSGLQESVNKAAKKVQERKQQLDAEVRGWDDRRREEQARLAELKGQATDVEQARLLLDEERKLHDTRVARMQQDLEDQTAALKAREDDLDADRDTVERDQARLKEDLLRLDRLRAELTQREQKIDERNQDLDRRLEQLRTDTADMEAQVVQLDEWHTKLSAVGEKLAKQKTEQEQVSQQLAQRAAALEGQQAALAALRTRLEKLREDARQQEQQLGEQRTRQEAAEAALQEKQDEVRRLREELDGDRTLLDQERRMLADRGAVLDNAVSQLRQAQERLAADEARVREQSQALDAATATQAEAASLLQARITQYEELHKRLEAERDNVRERTLLLAQAEQARETLQEQLRRRSEELAARQKALAEQTARHEADLASVQTQRDQWHQHQLQHTQALAAERKQLDERAAELEKTRADLDVRVEALRQERERFEETNRTFADESKELSEQRIKFDAERRAAEEAAQKARADFDAARREAQALQQQLPELELRAGTALERLTHVREQMREHLGEVHAYAGQCREELDGLRAQLQAESERLQRQEQALRRGQDEQRLAVAGFRQQLIDWQGQIADMKRVLARDETRLEQRQAQVAEQARQLGADTVRLAQQAEQLQEKEREVAEKRSEMDRHLSDMRVWYRRKLRELAGIREPEDAEAEAAETGPRRDILSLTGDVDPIDRKLGDLMRSLGLIEADTLTALLVEARRQRRSLRQVLLASGAVTLYQMALIEAGNLDALMLGPVRVVDRLRSTPREAVYRVFDPRRGSDAVLRHLAEAEMADAAKAEEFRTSFGKALLDHPNLAGTLEVLEIACRPAALQEWLAGLPANDWPPLVAAPGVWYRLLLQAVQALHAAHEAGMVHGHLQDGHFVLTGDGVLKVCGFGEPAWLIGGTFTTDAAGDLSALGKAAAQWCVSARKKAVRGKALPESLESLLNRLGNGLTSAAAVLEELEKASASVPANPEAWDRLVRHVKENAAPLAALRQSA